MFDLEIKSTLVMATLERLVQAEQNASPLMSSIAAELARQTEKNFAAQGRPRWLGLSRVTLESRVLRGARNKKGGTRKDGRISKAVGGSGMILQVSGQLAASVSIAADASSATIGSNKVYAAMMQFGGKKSQFPKLWGDIPARPFLPIDAGGNLQPEAETAILGLANDYLQRVIG